MRQKKHGLQKLIIGLIILAIVCAVGYLGYGKYQDDNAKTDAKGTGSKAVTIVVTDDNAKATTYEINTDQEYLRDVLDELAEAQEFTFFGDESEYGLYVTTINGVVADYDADEAYWSWYVNDEYCNYGIDSQPVADGDVFDVKYEVYEEPTE